LLLLLLQRSALCFRVVDRQLRDEVEDHHELQQRCHEPKVAAARPAAATATAAAPTATPDPSLDARSTLQQRGHG
jgi:hypothetical protein